MIRFALAAALLTLALASPAQADMTLKQFRNYSAMPGGTPLVRSYLGGLRDGVVMLQDVLREQHGIAPTFCPDGNELKKGTRFEDVLFDEIANPSSGEPWPDDMQMARVVAITLQSAFPCETY